MMCVQDEPAKKVDKPIIQYKLYHTIFINIRQSQSIISPH
jgi:hypothetical protein